MKIVVQYDDGKGVEITAGVQVCYDAVLNSLDWQSGFLSSEEMGQVIELGRACGFTGWEEQWEALQAAKAEEERLAEVNRLLKIEDDRAAEERRQQRAAARQQVLAEQEAARNRVLRILGLDPEA